MKKTILSFILAACLSVSAFASPADETGPGVRTGLRLYGGLSTMNGGDFNTGLRGWLDLWAHAGSLWGVRTDVEGSPGGWATSVGADVLFPLTSWLSFGMGAGWVSGRADCRSVADGNGDVVPTTQNIEMSPRALPVRAGFFGRIPLSGRLALGLNAGASYYYVAQAQAVYRRDWEDYWEEDLFDLKSSGWGYDGGLGLEFRMSRHVAVFFEGQARRARFSKFFGTLDRSSSEAGETSREGTLYAIDFSLGDGEIFPLVDVLSQPPAGPAFSRAAEAVVDFGGFGFLAGVLFRI
ncbi:MAG: outer membrane beta-barrel protein [Candidatus Aminicenantes bacterium]|nr:outer membrane beta-barrel protein [Candidatus Aminicenantes bacterium]